MKHKGFARSSGRKKEKDDSIHVKLCTKHTGYPIGDHSLFGASGQDTKILNRSDSAYTCVNGELTRLPYVPCVLVKNGLTLLGQKARGHPSPTPASSNSVSGTKLSSVASRFGVSIHYGGLEEPCSSYLESRHDQPEAIL